MFASERYDGDPAESKPVPRRNRMRRPVAAIVTLCCYAFVSFQGTREIIGADDETEGHRNSY